MTTRPRILAFSGSLRQESLNHRLVRVAAAGAEAAGADVTVLELRELPLPVYDGDLEQREGLPENARTLKEIMKAHDGFLIASPENNSSVSAALKNAIDWASRPAGDEPTLVCFRDRVAVIMAASPGALGGLRGLVALRSILSNIGVLVLPDQKAVAGAHEAFAEDGRLVDAKQQAAVEQLGAKLAGVMSRLQG